CPAVLIENFFMDNKQDLAYLLSQEGRREIIETIIDGIERCVLTLVSG
ncbi:MAG: N-acetylmuramoyl-L-alanine amidase, partial [Bacteroidales bacterium]|nr:N-acetylmuramoyl-L-alanine amidase [Bacteroidales bacterium]